MSRKLVCFCLWGSSDLYNHGLWENALLMPTIFPDWIMHVSYTPTANQDVIKQLLTLPWVETQLYNLPDHPRNLMLRYFPATNTNNNILIFRDADSRISRRDFFAVMDWLNTTKDVHIIRDHPMHNIHILGGLWGVRNGLFSNPKIRHKFIRHFNSNKHKLDTDQRFLCKVFYPLIKNNTCIHASFNLFEPWAAQFPPQSPPRQLGFCGQTVSVGDPDLCPPQPSN